MAAEFRAHELLLRAQDTLASGDLIKRPFQASLIACDERDVTPLQRDIAEWLREYAAAKDHTETQRATNADGYSAGQPDGQIPDSGGPRRETSPDAAILGAAPDLLEGPEDSPEF
jgi:hypothetical protein